MTVGTFDLNIKVGGAKIRAFAWESVILNNMTTLAIKICAGG